MTEGAILFTAFPHALQCFRVFSSPFGSPFSPPDFLGKDACPRELPSILFSTKRPTNTRVESLLHTPCQIHYTNISLDRERRGRLVKLEALIFPNQLWKLDTGIGQKTKLGCQFFRMSYASTFTLRYQIHTVSFVAAILVISTRTSCLVLPWSYKFPLLRSLAVSKKVQGFLSTPSMIYKRPWNQLPSPNRSQNTMRSKLLYWL
jgi:hypothetical protein